jgi:tRNA A-37 threonylcarbamoyl transferase component Bud32
MQTNLELWLDRTLRIGACGTWWAAGTPGGQTLGTLQLDPDLVALPAVRDRVAAAVAAVRAANPSGVMRTTELVYDARRAWLVVATVPKPTLADLLAVHATLPPGAASALAVEIARALRELHAAGLSHGDLEAGTVVLTGAGGATLAEVGVLAAVRDAPTDIGVDAIAWAALVRELAGRADPAESSILVGAAAVAEAGDLTAAARQLTLRAVDLPDFETREALSTLIPALEPAPAPARIPAQRVSTMDTPGSGSGAPPPVRVVLRLGPGVPDAALLHPRPVDAVLASGRRRAWRRVLGWLTLAVALLGAAAGASWWFLLR